MSDQLWSYASSCTSASRKWSETACRSSTPHHTDLWRMPTLYLFSNEKRIVEETLIAEGITREKFSVIPFPLERQDVLVEYFPEGNVCFTTLHSDWNHVKIKMLQELGYDVRVL